MKNTVSGSTIYSDYNMCYISVAEEGWGDITTEDQVQWASPDEVPDGFWVAAASIPELVYNGKAQKPDSFRVYDHNKLINSKNYKIAYSNNINAGLFTYPGPKPQSKEAGILMMADAVEARSRSLKEFTPQSIHQMVEQMVGQQVSEGQFSECSLTLRDIETIKQVFTEKLISMNHHRISYPEVNKR